MTKLENAIVVETGPGWTRAYLHMEQRYLFAIDIEEGELPELVDYSIKAMKEKLLHEITTLVSDHIRVVTKGEKNEMVN